MKSIGELVVRVADLVEAEGRSAKRNIVRVLTTTVIFLTASVLCVSGVVALCAAAFLGLRTVMHPGWALGIVSLAPLLGSVVCALVGLVVLRGGKGGS